MRAFFAAVLVPLLLLSACSSLEYTAEETVQFWEMAFNLHLDERDFNQEPDLVFHDTTLQRLLDNPTAYLRMNVTFTAMMRNQDESRWESYYSGIREENYYGFSVWPTGAKLWTEEGYASAIDTLYVYKKNPYFDSFLAVEKYEVIEIRGKVLSDFNDQPWIECYYIDYVASPVYSEHSLLGLVRGTTEHKDKFYAKAIHSLETALTGTLPAEARHSAHLQLGDLYFGRAAISRDQSDFRKAIDHYDAAADLDAKDVGARKSLEQARKELERQIQIDERRREEEERRKAEAERKQRELEERERRARESKKEPKKPKKNP